MKFNGKSNLVLTMLLFFFCHFAARAGGLPERADTVVIDGEVIYIEPEDVEMNMDSLELSLHQDFRKARTLPQALWTFSSGVRFDYLTRISRVDTLQSLDEFVGVLHDWSMSPTVSCDVNVKISSWVGATLGLSYSSASYKWNSLSEDELASAQSRFRFENRDGELWQYATYEVGPGFETDTSQIMLSRQRFTRHLLEVPVMIRFNPPHPVWGENWSPYAEAGILLSRQFKAVFPDPSRAHSYMLNERGYLVPFRVTESDRKVSAVRFQLTAGVLRSVSSKWQLRAQISSGLLSQTVNDNQWWKMTSTGAGLSVGICRNFDKK
jgi:hypothetical protein